MSFVHEHCAVTSDVLQRVQLVFYIALFRQLRSAAFVKIIVSDLQRMQIPQMKSTFIYGF